MRIPKISPKRFFSKPKKDPSKPSRSDPNSFNSGVSSESSSSDSSSSVHKRASSAATPTSVLPQWQDCNFDVSRGFKFVERKELEAVLARLGAQPPSQAEVSLLLREVGVCPDERVPLDALMNRVGSEACDSELRETFDFFDEDHDGKITAEELWRVFTTLGDEECTLEECERMIAEVDKNGEGFVCFEDFAHMMELQRCD